MRVFYGVLVASVAFVGVAFADSPIASLFGNTVVITSAAGVTKAMVNADHSYSTVMPDGSTLKGTWAENGDNTCYTQTDPAPAADYKPFCAPNVARAVGDTWDAKGPDGSDVKFTLVAGH